MNKPIEPKKPELRQLHEYSEAPVEVKKVYCSNCKYHRNIQLSYIGHIPSPDRCSHPSQIRADNSAVKPSFSLPYCCESINKNNDCKDYKRKWWKFWVK